MITRLPNALLATLAGLLFVLVAADDCSAQQRRIPRYAPQTPTTSPYLSFFNPGGAVSSYYNIIRPLETQRAVNRQQDQLLQSQNLRIDQFQTELEEPTVRSTGQSSWFRQGSPQNHYRNRSHYYERWDSRNRGQR